jgi:hypothetical protein
MTSISFSAAVSGLMDVEAPVVEVDFVKLGGRR